MSLTNSDPRLAGELQSLREEILKTFRAALMKRKSLELTGGSFIILR
jgi:hypothetical protein